MPETTVAEKVALTVEQLDAMADAIDAIDEGMKRIRSGKMNERAILLLLADASGLNKSEVLKVLEAMDGLKFRFRRRNAKGEYL